jgi:hypothetical protein
MSNDPGLTPGDQIFFLGKNPYGNTSCVSNVFFLKKNLYGNMSCVSNVFFLKKNEKFFNRKNIIKMNHFIHIFFWQKMVYFTEKKKCVKNDLFLNWEKFWEKCKKNIIFFHVRKTECALIYSLSVYSSTH